MSGTPGTGKTTLSTPVADELGLEVVHLNEEIRGKDLVEGYEDSTAVADLEAVRGEFQGADDVLIEGHLSHYLEADAAVVLRCRPDSLYERLRMRFNDEKSRENAEAEALDIVLAEALEHQDVVVEVDTTGKSPGDAAEEIAGYVRDGESRTEVVDWSSYLEGLE